MIKIGQLSRVLAGFRSRATQTTRVPVLSRHFSLSASRQQTLDAAAANKKARFELAASYRGMEKYNFHEAVCNHLSVMCPAADGQGEVMLLIPYGLHWKEVTASNLIGLNDDNEVVEGSGEPELSAATIHRGVHQSRPDARAVFHLHMPYSTALGCLEDPTLRMIHQNSIYYYNKTAYDTEYTGLSSATEEGKRLAAILKDNHVLFMCNHGTLVVGPSCESAFNRTYYLERACMVQIHAMSTGRKMREISQDVLDRTSRQYEETDYWEPYDRAHFMAVVRDLERECPEFAK